MLPLTRFCSRPHPVIIWDRRQLRRVVETLRKLATSLPVPLIEGDLRENEVLDKAALVASRGRAPGGCKILAHC